ncbi:hypothetical protein HGA64_00255 [Candidatus Falkowbacteria bacterium]|nr:hypothetical protein [Candidatus Falkowbacteria bacterium]
MDKTIAAYIDEVKRLAVEKNWGISPDEINLPEKFALLHSEVSEAYEAYRRGRSEGPDCISEELADIAIRLFHLCAILEVDLPSEINKKIERNKNRDWNHKNEQLANKNNV